MKKYIILDPHSSQSLAIAKVLQDLKISVYAGVIKDGAKKLPTGYYNSTIDINSENIIVLNNEYIIIPTTAQSTKFYFGIIPECRLNEITFSRKALFVYDKPKMLDYVDSIGIPIPKTYYRIEDVKEFPVFYKQDMEKGGGLRGIAYSMKDLIKIKPEGLLYQEYIPGKSTYGVSFLARNGELLEYFMHNEIFSIPKPGGSAVIIEKHFDVKLLDYTERIIKGLNYSGWGLAEYKYCPGKDEFYFMEVNAKFWASCEFAFMNNRFIKQLFNDKNDHGDYKEKNAGIDGAVFLDRLMRSRLLDILKHIKYIFSHKIIYYDNPFLSFVKGRIPKGLKQKISKLIIKHV